MYNKVIRTRVSDQFYNSNKSTVQNGGEKLWFAPGGILCHLEKYWEDILNAELDAGLREKIQMKCYKEQAYAISIRYRRWCLSKELCNHYGVNTQIISDEQMIANLNWLNEYLLSRESDETAWRLKLLIKLSPAIIKFQYAVGTCISFLRIKLGKMKLIIRKCFAR